MRPLIFYLLKSAIARHGKIRVNSTLLIWLNAIVRFHSPWLDWSSIRRLCFTCFSAPSVLLFQRVFPLPHNCGAAAPQLWGNDDKGDQNNYLACRNNYKGEKLFYRRITLVFFLFIFLVNGNLVVVDYCTSY